MSTRNSTDPNGEIGAQVFGEPAQKAREDPTQRELQLDSTIVEMNLSGQGDDLPARIRTAAHRWAQHYQDFISERIRRQHDNLSILYERQVREQAGTRINDLMVGTYVCWDLLVLPPLQFHGLQPFRPQKAILAGEWALLPSMLFINPTSSGGHLPATTVFGGRRLSLCYRHLDVGNVRSGPELVYEAQLAVTAPVLTAFLAFHRFDTMGGRSNLVDLTVTAELVDLGQPFAALQTNHYDLDADPSFLHIPPEAPQYRDQVPLRFMVCPRPGPFRAPLPKGAIGKRDA